MRWSSVRIAHDPPYNTLITLSFLPSKPASMLVFYCLLSTGCPLDSNKPQQKPLGFRSKLIRKKAWILSGIIKSKFRFQLTTSKFWTAGFGQEPPFNLCLMFSRYVYHHKMACYLNRPLYYATDIKAQSFNWFCPVEKARDWHKNRMLSCK